MQIGSKWHRQTKKKRLSGTVSFGVEEEGESERRTKRDPHIHVYKYYTGHLLKLFRQNIHATTEEFLQFRSSDLMH